MYSVKFVLVLAAALGGSAFAAEPVPAPATQASTSAPASPPAAAPTLDQRIATAKKAGYKIVDKDGETMFCRTRLKTGSRLVRETECLTAEQIDDLADASRRGVAEMMRRPPPPQGH